MILKSFNIANNTLISRAGRKYWFKVGMTVEPTEGESPKMLFDKATKVLAALVEKEINKNIERDKGLIKRI